MDCAITPCARVSARKLASSSSNSIHGTQSERHTEKSMRIALLTDKISTGGGLEHIYQLCAGMGDIQFGVFGQSGDANNKFAQLKNVELVFSNDTKTVDRFAPDLVHYHHLKPLARLSAPAGRKLFTVHGVHLHRYEFQRGVRPMLERFARLTLERVLYQRLDRIITVSAEDAAYLSRHYGCKSTTIYNGIDFAPIERVTASKEALRARLGLPQDKSVYLTVARFDFPKGHDVLVRAIAAMKEQGTLGARVFVFAGDGALMPAVRELAASLGVAEQILFLGTRTDVYELMAATDVFVLPSRWEGMPITLIEALVARRPAVASRTYGISTVARETGNNVRLFENENAADLANVLAEPVSFEPCSLEMFRLQSMIDATRKVYLET
jgi:glycosyltransferase involved in cell wall biosynthesis